MDEYSWASAVGRMRIKEKEFLPRTVLSEAASAKDFAGALGALRDTVYGHRLADLESSTQRARLLRSILDRALEDAYSYAEDISPNRLYLTVFRARYDFHNLKTLLKQTHLGLGADEQALSGLGSLSVDEMRGIAFHESPDESIGDEEEGLLADISQLRDVLTQACAQVDAEFSEIAEDASADQIAFGIDASIDRAYYRWAATVFARSGHEGLGRFFGSEIDILNLKMAARVLRLGIPPAFASLLFLEGGEVPPQTVLDALTLSADAGASAGAGAGAGAEALAAAYKGSKWEGLAREGASTAREGKSLSAWEKSCDNALMSVVSEARLYSMGPEPIFGFLFGKESEIRNLRVILSGKDSGAPAQEISERLRDPYV